MQFLQYGGLWWRRLRHGHHDCRKVEWTRDRSGSLCHEAGVTILRGMQVNPDYRRKGIGRSLLKHCILYLNGGIAYCLPYEHLAKFYGQGGFVLAPQATLPLFLGERLAAYALSGQRTLAMQRS